jgi:hypothetical protein
VTDPVAVVGAVTVPSVSDSDSVSVAVSASETVVGSSSAVVSASVSVVGSTVRSSVVSCAAVVGAWVVLVLVGVATALGTPVRSQHLPMSRARVHLHLHPSP